MKRSIKLLWFLVITLVLLVIGAAYFALKTPSQSAVDKFLVSQHVNYNPVLPIHLPSGARLNLEGSNYNDSSKLLKITWDFPAQTLPGQGSLIVLQYPNDSHQEGLLPKITSQKEVALDINTQSLKATIGTLATSASLPPFPGQIAMRTSFSGKELVLISYAISEQELIKVAESLR